MTRLGPALLHYLFLILFIAFLLSIGTSTSFCVERAQAETLVPLHIKKGTNLINIASQYCKNRGDWKRIAQINQLTPPYLIIANKTIQVPFDSLKVKHFSARVASVHGTVKVMQDKTVIGEIRKNDTILPGQTIVTEAESYTHLIFPDHKYTRIAPNSELTINYLVRLADDQLKVELFLKKGRLIQLIKRKLKDNETFNTRTPVSITGVRGTEFRLKMMGKDTNIAETIIGNVKVKAAGKTIGLKKGQGSKVIQGKPPMPPRPLPEAPASPQLESVYKVLPVVFPAPGHKEAKFIRLRLTRDRQGKETLLEKEVGPGQDFMLAALTDGVYFCFLTATDNENFESLPSGPFPLKVRTIPAAPLLSTPKNNLQTWDKNIDVKWLKSEHADHYRIELASDPEFTHLIDNSRRNEPTYRTPELQPGTYYFRVQAVAKDGFTSLFSMVLSWKIAKPSTLAPITGSSEEGLAVQWSSSAKNVKYELQIGRKGNFNNPVISKQGLTTPSYLITTYLEPGDYHVRIRSVLEDGQTSPWTPPQILTIEQEPFGFDHALVILTLFIFALL